MLHYKQITSSYMPRTSFERENVLINDSADLQVRGWRESLVKGKQTRIAFSAIIKKHKLMPYDCKHAHERILITINNSYKSGKSNALRNKSRSTEGDASERNSFHLKRIAINSHQEHQALDGFCVQRVM